MYQETYPVPHPSTDKVTEVGVSDLRSLTIGQHVYVKIPCCTFVMAVTSDGDRPTLEIISAFPRKGNECPWTAPAVKGKYCLGRPGMASRIYERTSSYQDSQLLTNAEMGKTPLAVIIFPGDHGIINAVFMARVYFAPNSKANLTRGQNLALSNLNSIGQSLTGKELPEDLHRKIGQWLGGTRKRKTRGKSNWRKAKKRTRQKTKKKRKNRKHKLVRKPRT